MRYRERFFFIGGVWNTGKKLFFDLPIQACRYRKYFFSILDNQTINGIFVLCLASNIVRIVQGRWLDELLLIYFFFRKFDLIELSTRKEYYRRRIC